MQTDDYFLNCLPLFLVLFILVYYIVKIMQKERCILSQNVSNVSHSHINNIKDGKFKEYNRYIHISFYAY